MINVQDLHFTYPDGHQALHSISLAIRPGERLALIGANGSGKSTLALCLNGLLKPTDGDVSVDGHSTKDIAVQQTLRRLVGLVFQYPDDQLVAASVEAEIAFGLENLALPSEQISDRIEEVLSAFDLGPYRHHPPHLLSGGEKQRLAIAATIALQPHYLVLDEPTALLDPPARQRLDTLIRRLQKEWGIAIVVITQHPSEAAQADRVLLLHQGRLVRDAAPQSLFRENNYLATLGLEPPFIYALAHRLSLPLDMHCSISSLATHIGDTILPTPALSPIPSTTPPVKLSTESLCYSHEGIANEQPPTLEDITITIGKGQAIALIGPSGAGKTTLAQHFNGLLKPQAGRVLLDGDNIWHHKAQMASIRRRVGLVFQFPEFQLFEDTVARDVAFGLRPLGLSIEQASNRVCRALEQVGLPYDEFAQRRPLSLSGGEKRRVALAGVLAMEPEVLVLDEPTAGLDPQGVKKLVDILEELRCHGTTLVLITHDMDLAATLATHLILLRQGKVQLIGNVRATFSREDFAALSGLEPPQAVQFVQALTAQGTELPSDIIRFSEIFALFNTP
jgi:energy-coupling factor transport system ATP-binding protein